MRATVEDAPFRLSIHDFADRDLLRPGAGFTLALTEGDRTGSIKVQIDTVNPVPPALAELVTRPVPARLRAVLHYPPIIQPGAPPETVRDEIWFDRKARGFAAAGWQFICPGCGRRVADLYLLELYFRCRRCGNLGYPSQRQSREIRGLRPPTADEHNTADSISRTTHSPPPKNRLDRTAGKRFSHKT